MVTMRKLNFSRGFNLRYALPLLAATAVLALVVSLKAKGQEVSSGLPVVTTIGVPTYPIAARLAHAEGIVRIKVITDGRGVKDTEVQGSPPLLLAGLAEQNIRTWQFQPAEPTSFTVTYTYKLVHDSFPGGLNTSVRLELPTDVEVTATRLDYVDTAPTSK
jgi:Gram-negative bacterial TonB protein C-terminal